MSYRIKVLIVLVGVVLLSNALSLGLLHWKLRGQLFEEMRTQALSIAASGAATIDGDLLRGIDRPEALKTPGYAAVQKQLRAVRDANQRDDFHVSNIYTLHRPPGRDDLIVFGVDAEEKPEDFAQPGEVYKFKGGHAFVLGQPQVDTDFTEDQWGTWLIANAPIRDSSGNAVAALVVDVPAAHVANEMHHQEHIVLLALGVAVALSLGVSLLIAGAVTRPLRALGAAVAAIGKGDFDARANVTTRDEFGELAATVNQMAAGLKQREALKVSFARYVSQQVMDKIIESGQLPVPSGERRRVTVLFADIRGFTTLSEKMAPEQVVALLNEYFEKMIEAIVRNQGTLDKFIGDGIMAVFGSPLADAHQEEHALRAAVEMRQELARLCEKWQAQGRPPIRIGIGINSGAAIVGNIGSSERMEYTAIGDTVNLASRLESATKELGVDLAVSEYTIDGVRGQFAVRRLGPVHVKGRDEPITAYTIDGE